MNATVQARLVADFTSEVEADDPYVSYGFGLGGEILVAIRQSREDPAVESPGFASFPKSRLDAGGDYRLLVQRPGQPLIRIQVRDEQIPCSYLQPVPDGVLLVGARCSWPQSEPEPEKNAVVFDHSSREGRRFCLGDGIQDVRVDPGGSIRVSYFDEGIRKLRLGGVGTAAPWRCRGREVRRVREPSRRVRRGGSGHGGDLRRLCDQPRGGGRPLGLLLHGFSDRPLAPARVPTVGVRPRGSDCVRRAGRPHRSLRA